MFDAIFLNSNIVNFSVVFFLFEFKHVVNVHRFDFSFLIQTSSTKIQRTPLWANVHYKIPRKKGYPVTRE